MKIALTGGPSGGKTTFANLIKKEFKNQVVIVPEAASILYGGGFPRRPGLRSAEHRQKAIYFVQRELESLVGFESPEALLVCDRGSLDGVAYWPSNGNDFFTAVGSSLEAEIARYDFVMHLDTARETDYDLTNPLRTESYLEAWELNERIKSAWAKHPRRLVINNCEFGNFMNKLNRAVDVIRDIITQKNFNEIQGRLNRAPERTLEAQL